MGRSWPEATEWCACWRGLSHTASTLKRRSQLLVESVILSLSKRYAQPHLHGGEARHAWGITHLHSHPVTIRPAATARR